MTNLNSAMNAYNHQQDELQYQYRMSQLQNAAMQDYQNRYLQQPMYAMNRNWWDDRDFMKSISLECTYDPLQDRMHMRRTFVENGEKKYYNMTFDARIMQGMSAREVVEEFNYQYMNSDEYTHSGPSNKELRDPRIREAWEQFGIIKRLIIGK